MSNIISKFQCWPQRILFVKFDPWTPKIDFNSFPTKEPHFSLIWLNVILLNHISIKHYKKPQIWSFLFYWWFSKWKNWKFIHKFCSTMYTIIYILFYFILFFENLNLVQKKKIELCQWITVLWPIFGKKKIQTHDL